MTRRERERERERTYLFPGSQSRFILKPQRSLRPDVCEYLICVQTRTCTRSKTRTVNRGDLDHTHLVTTLLSLCCYRVRDLTGPEREREEGTRREEDDEGVKKARRGKSKERERERDRK